jgi:hypothetical protein
MPIRPSGLPSWASSATNIAEPTDAKKAVGWATNEQPPSSYFNWLQEKTGAWIRYLSYDTVIDDDFVFDPGLVRATGTYGSSGNRYGWGVTAGVSGSGDWFVGGAAGEDAVGTVFHTIRNAASGYGRLEKYVSFNASRDIIGEIRLRPYVPSGLNEGYIQAGFVFPSGLVGGGGQAMFLATGITQLPVWSFMWSPSLLGPTSVSLGVTSTPSAYQRLQFERVGETMTVAINGASLVSFYAGNINFSGARFGVYVDHREGAGSFGGVHVDKMKLGVAR